VDQSNRPDRVQRHLGTEPGRPPGIAEANPLEPLDRRVVLVGGIVFTVLMLLSGRYGFHRDELYFLDCARHLQGGYVDQPVFAPLLAWVTLAVFGVSLPGLRLWPALAAWSTIVVAALIARELGGGRRSQLFAALATATMPALLAIDHVEGPTAFDLLAWPLLALFVIRVARTGNFHWWLPAGVVLGVGLANKHSIGFFAVAIFLGVLVSGGHRYVLNRWFLAGAVVAGAFTVPDLVWQAQHGWATIAMTRSLNAENGGLANVGSWIGGQLVMASVGLIFVWPAGLRYLWRSGIPLWRALVWAYGILFVLFAVTTGAKIYYLAGAYVYLLAAGAVSLDGWLGARAHRPRDLALLTALTTLVALPIVLPVLPASDIGWFHALNQDPAETVGWPQFVSSVRSVWFSLPPPTRADAVIFTANYGEAGAINELGRSAGLPTAVSGQNSEWWWGPGDPDATTVVAVAPGPSQVTGYSRYLTRFFSRVRTVATLSNPAGVHNQEWGGHIYVCTHPRHQWARMWPQLRHYE